MTQPFDALLLMSFGGPESPDEVVPFLENVTRGSGIPKERLVVVGQHYFGFGGKSPINDQNRALMAALDAEFATRGVDLPIFWGNRNWHPLTSEATRQLRDAGARRVAVLTTSAYPSYAGCRSYREALAANSEGLEFFDVGNYGLDAGFVTANADALASALTSLPDAQIIFVTHSIPVDMAETSGPNGGAYVDWHLQVARRVLDQIGRPGEPDLVYCSRSGRPGQPWLEPDINDHLASLRELGVREVALAPIGFISDHMEVVYDLDTQARGTCDELGIRMVRAATAGIDPGFVAGLADRVLARGRAVEPGCDNGECLRCPGSSCCPNPRDPATPAID